jgi:hypothetical protein
MQPRFFRSAIVAAAFGAFALHATGAEPVHINLPAFSCHSGTYGAKLPSTLSALRSLGPLKSEEQGEVQVSGRATARLRSGCVSKAYLS